jgi:hypothetical protein
MKCLSIKSIFVSISKMVENLYSDADFTVPQYVIKSSRLLQWFRLWSGSVYHQIIYSLQWLHMHLMHRILLEPHIAMSLYKGMPSCNASSHFTHTLSTPSHTTIVNMPRYLIPSWNECPFCRYHQRAKLTTSLEASTHGRRCWVCPDTNLSDGVGLSISIS